MTQIQQQNQSEILSSLVINGDLSKLTPQQKVEYYKMYCERQGLDPVTKPFQLLRLNGKEILYCDRSGAAQLNKKHQISHAIQSREKIEGVDVYQVTARASNPEGRFSDSIGAVNVGGLKGEAYANAIMKAETKAKRRATLDLLGLGLLDETETQDIPNAQTLDIEHTDIPNAQTDTTDYSDWQSQLKQCNSEDELVLFYNSNKAVVEADSKLKALFTDRKKHIRTFKGQKQPA